MNKNLRRSQPSQSLFSTLVGLYPLILFGPCIVLLSYPYPPPAWRQEPVVRAIQLALTVLPILAGFTIGWMRRFPLWSYPYTGAAAGYLLILLLSFPSLLNWRPEYLALAGLGLAILLMIAVLLRATRRDQPLAQLRQDIRADWTRLSFGLLIVPMFLFSNIDHSEDPSLTLFVIGPTLVITLTALLYFIFPGKPARSILLASGMLLALLIRLPSGA